MSGRKDKTRRSPATVAPQPGPDGSGVAGADLQGADLEAAEQPEAADAAYRFPIAHIPDLRAAGVVPDRSIERRKMEEISQLLHLPDTLDEAERNVRILRAIELYQSLDPRDGMEGMLAAQMVGAHHAAMECLRRAAIPGQFIPAQEMYLRNAQRMMGLYMKQAAALDRRRSAAATKVTVGNVTVAEGGQAIVGHVELTRKGHDDVACHDGEGAMAAPERAASDRAEGSDRHERRRSASAAAVCSPAAMEQESAPPLQRRRRATG